LCGVFSLAGFSVARRCNNVASLVPANMAECMVACTVDGVVDGEDIMISYDANSLAWVRRQRRHYILRTSSGSARARSAQQHFGKRSTLCVW
jgi:hypothetical protein